MRKPKNRYLELDFINLILNILIGSKHMSYRVAFIGLGVMGFPMAGFISKAGHDVTVYNRTSAKANKWAETFKGNTAPTPADAAKDADFIFTCVGNDNDLKEVTIGSNGAFQNTKKGAIFIDNTTAPFKFFKTLSLISFAALFVKVTQSI